MSCFTAKPSCLRELRRSLGDRGPPGTAHRPRFTSQGDCRWKAWRSLLLRWQRGMVLPYRLLTGIALPLSFARHQTFVQRHPNCHQPDSPSLHAIHCHLKEEINESFLKGAARKQLFNPKNQSSMAEEMGFTQKKNIFGKTEV